MILSFHPIYEGDRNLLVAGREPGTVESQAIRAAEAVVLPQGCSRQLFRMVKAHRRPVFPNYDARFQYPGKIGQIELFRTAGTRHPPTHTFEDADDLYRRHGNEAAGWPFHFPLVLKYDWGGEGEAVRLLTSAGDLRTHLEHADAFAGGGNRRFLLQRYIPHHRRVMRVVVIGTRLHAYWRVQAPDGPLPVNVAAGAHIDHHIQPSTKRRAFDEVEDFCRRTGINLAGFDLLFPQSDGEGHVYFLEINYFFGRRGLGGSEPYYRLLIEAIDQWLASLGLAVGGGRS